MLPVGIVDPVRDLKEDHEVLRPKIERLVGTAEIETRIGPQIAFGILARMPLVRLTRSIGSHRSRSVRSCRPKQDFIRRRQITRSGTRTPIVLQTTATISFALSPRAITVCTAFNASSDTIRGAR